MPEEDADDMIKWIPTTENSVDHEDLNTLQAFVDAAIERMIDEQEGYLRRLLNAGFSIDQIAIQRQPFSQEWWIIIKPK